MKNVFYLFNHTPIFVLWGIIIALIAAITFVHQADSRKILVENKAIEVISDYNAKVNSRSVPSEIANGDIAQKVAYVTGDTMIDFQGVTTEEIVQILRREDYIHALDNQEILRP